MRKIILYGEMGKRFGREHKFSVKTAAEAIQAMCANFSGFRDYMKDAHKYGFGFSVSVGDNQIEKAKDTTLPSSESEDIVITPLFFGSGGVVKIIIGAVLVTAGILLGWTGGGSTLIPIGASLILNGTFELLAGPPRLPSTGGGLGDSSQSFIFSGPENVTRQGGAVPVGYGRMMVGSTAISAGIEDSDQ